MRLIDADALKEQWDIMMYGEPHGCSFRVIDKAPTIIELSPDNLVEIHKITNKEV